MIGAGVLAVVAGVVGVLGVSGRLPLRPLLTFLQFKLDPAKTRIEQLVRLQHPQTGVEVFLVGTTHHYHYDDNGWTVWNLKAVVERVQPDTMLIEMMADAVVDGRVGEGPVEMPFLATLGAERGVHVVGIDSGWDGGWQGRQQRMFEQVQTALSTTTASTGTTPKRVLLASGMMHLQPFVEQLSGAGFVVQPWSDDERKAVSDDAGIAQVWPKGLAPALRAAIARAKSGTLDTDPQRAADMGWFIQIREQILDKMGEPH
ncbi:MAG TPA: hypothetical protein VGF99_02000 [Myxococcota bacterium]